MADFLQFKNQFEQEMEVVSTEAATSIKVKPVKTKKVKEVKKVNEILEVKEIKEIKKEEKPEKQFEAPPGPGPTSYAPKFNTVER